MLEELEGQKLQWEVVLLNKHPLNTVGITGRQGGRDHVAEPNPKTRWL